MRFTTRSRTRDSFCILQYTTEAEAKAALKALDGLVLDPRHTFKVLPYSALEAAANTPDVYATPEVLIPDKPNLKHWMMDPRGCDQFLIHYDRTKAKERERGGGGVLTHVVCRQHRGRVEHDRLHHYVERPRSAHARDVHAQGRLCPQLHCLVTARLVHAHCSPSRRDAVGRQPALFQASGQGNPASKEWEFAGFSPLFLNRYRP